MKYRLLLVFALFAGVLSAQESQVNLRPSIFFDRGLELFDEKKYNAAVTQFNLFLENNPSQGERSEAEYYLAMSKMYAEHSDGEASVLRFLADNPGSHKTHMANLALGDYYYLKQKYSTALSYYKAADVSALAMADVDRYLFRKGYSQVATRRYRDAAETLQPLTERENEYRTLAMYYYGYCAYFTGQYADALKAFKEIENEGPKYVRIYIAQIYYLQNQYDKAIAAADKITSGVPKNRVNFLKGKCYYRLAQYENAAEAYNNSAMVLDSLDKNEVYEFGYSNYKAGNYAKASEWFKNIAFQGDSMSQFASYNLADCFLKLKSKRDAMNAFAEAYRSAFNKAVAEDALMNQAKIAVELQENNAASLLQRYIDNYPSSPKVKEAKKLLAKLLLNTDNYRDAVNVLESISDLDAQTEESYQRVTLARGMELFRARQWKDATAMFDKCMSKSANRGISGQAAFWKAETLAQQNLLDQAEPLYQRFINSPNSDDNDYFSYAYYGLGYSQYKLEEYGDAVSYFEKFTKLASRGRYDEKIYNDAQLRLGDCNYAQAAKLAKDQLSEKRKNLDDAVKAYAYVTGKKGTDADYALFQTGMIYGLQSQLFNQSGLREKKITTLKRLVSDFNKSRFIPDAYFELGKEYWSAGNTRDAETNFMYIINDYKGNPLVMNCYLNLGRIYNNNGDWKKAIDMYTRLYDEYPGTPDARTAAENVKRIYSDQGKAGEYVKWSKNRGGISASETDSLLYSAAFNLYERDKYRDAVKSFDEYLGSMKNGTFVVSANYYKAICHEELKEKEEAIKHYKVVADANGNEFQEDAVLSLLRLYGPDGPCTDLVIYLEKIEKITKNRDTRYQSWKSLLHCYEKLNRVTEARDVASRINSEISSPDDLKAEAQVYVAKADFNDKKYTKALEGFSAVYNRFNNKFAAEAKYREGLVYLAMDSIESCKNSCYGVLDQFNSYDYWVGKAMLLLGDAFLKGGDEFNAKATWNSVVENFEIEEISKEAKDKLALLKNKKSRVNNLIDE